MKMALVPLTLLLINPMSISSAAAQTDEPQAEAQAAIQRSEAAREEAVREAMSFSAAEEEVFWPLYQDYRAEMQTLQQREVDLAFAMVEAYQELSNAAANNLLDEWLSLTGSRNAVKRRYIARFREILEPRRAARFIQVDNKLDAIVAFDAAQTMPLVR
jgi:hypothetical protein